VTWLKEQARTIITVATMLIAASMAFARLDSRQTELGFRQAELDQAMQSKVDRDVVLRELDQVHRDLAKITDRLDGVIIRQAVIADR
jgi:hypothetical protein